MSYEAFQVFRPLSPQSRADIGFVAGISTEFPRQEIEPALGQELGAVTISATEISAITERNFKNDWTKEGWLRKLVGHPLPWSCNEAVTLPVGSVDYFPGTETHHQLGITLEDTEGVLVAEFDFFRKRINGSARKMDRSEPFLYLPLATVAESSALDGILDWVETRKPATVELLPLAAPPLLQIRTAESAPVRSDTESLADIPVRRIDVTRRPPGAARMPGPPRPRAVSAGE